MLCLKLNKAISVMIKIIGVAAISLAVVGCGQVMQQQDWMPQNWQPSLQQVVDTFDEAVQTQTTQQALSNNSQNLADLVDAQLFIVYVQLMQLLSATEQSALFDDQQQWLEARLQQSTAAIVSTGGSLATLEYNDMFRQLTEARLAKLQQRLKQLNRK